VANFVKRTTKINLVYDGLTTIWVWCESVVKAAGWVYDGWRQFKFLL